MLVRAELRQRVVGLPPGPAGVARQAGPVPRARLIRIGESATP